MEHQTRSTITIRNERNEEGEYQILFTLESPDTNRNYIVYTDNKKNKEERLNVYANIYDKKGENKTLMPIETEEEWNLLETSLSKLEESGIKN